MLADTLGRPLRFRITAGQAHELTAAADLLKGQKAKAVLADKAYDSNDLRELIAAMKAETVIPSKRNRKVVDRRGILTPDRRPTLTPLRRSSRCA